jgi:hypothetical protein
LNDSGSSFTFGVQLYNPGAGSITVTKRNSGFAAGSGASGWRTVPGQVWSNFFQSPGGQTYTLNSGSSVWVLEGSVAAGDLFNACLRLESTGPVIVTAYAYKVKSNINGTATAIPYQGEAQYSGWGSGWFLSTNLTLTATDILSQPQQSVYHSLCHCSSGNSQEMIPINLVQGGTASCNQASPLHNIGNWGAQYFFSVSLVNNTSAPRQFIGYVGANPAGAFVALQSGSVVKYKLLETSTERRWKWMTQTVAAQSSATIDFQFIPCANSYMPIFMQWQVV